jgi:hypothetical protein
MMSRPSFPASGRTPGEAVAALVGPLNQGRLLQIGKPVMDPGLLAAGAACCHGGLRNRLERLGPTIQAHKEREAQTGREMDAGSGAIVAL